MVQPTTGNTANESESDSDSESEPLKSLSPLTDQDQHYLNTFTAGMVGLGRLVHADARRKGWWDKERNIGEMLMLAVDELSEAHEEYRKHGPDELKMYYVEDKHGTLKPEGFTVEIADTFIRLLENIIGLGLEDDFREAMSRKINYNRTRPFRHGGLYA